MALYFPLYADVTGKRCVVVGGGAVAERKVADLRNAGAAVRVVSPEVTDNLREQAQAANIEWLPVYYEAAHLEDAWLVFAATNNRGVNAQVAQDASARRVFANIADAPEEGAFLVPSVVRRGDLCLSVSTGGANPMLSRKVAQELEAQYGTEYGPLVELLGRMRAYIKTRTSVAARRRAALADLIGRESELRARLRSGDADEARQMAESIVQASLSDETNLE